MVALKIPFSLRTAEDARREAPVRLAQPKIERRVFPRKPCNDPVQVRRLDHTVMARQNPHLSMQLRDVSVGGCCALSDQPISAGERLTIALPAKGIGGGWHAFGKVIRCTPSATGWRVAVEFDALPAA